MLCSFVDKCYFIVETSITIVVLIVVLAIITKNVLLLGILLVLFAPLVPLSPVPDEGREIGNRGKWVNSGKWVDVYESEDSNFYKKVWKTYDRMDPFFTKSRCLLDYIVWHFCMASQWETLLIESTGSLSSFPIVKDINAEELSYLQEKCTVPKDKISTLRDFRLINEELEKCNMYYVDIHHRNVMVDSNGRVKFVDGELLTEKKFKLACFVHELLGHPLAQVHGFSRIYWSNEDLPPLDSIDHTGKPIRSGLIWS
jgi:hypothetical protein